MSPIYFCPRCSHWIPMEEVRYDRDPECGFLLCRQCDERIDFVRGYGPMVSHQNRAIALGIERSYTRAAGGNP